MPRPFSRTWVEQTQNMDFRYYMSRVLSITLQAGNAFVLLSGCLQARESRSASRRWQPIQSHSQSTDVFDAAVPEVAEDAGDGDVVVEDGDHQPTSNPPTSP